MINNITELLARVERLERQVEVLTTEVKILQEGGNI